jgi:predicted amidohydrolase
VVRIIFIGVIVMGVAAWFLIMRPSNLRPESDLHLNALLEKADGPSLVAIQPWLDERHYQSADHLQRHLRGYLQAARTGGAMPINSIVVFPEHIGTWLVAAQAPTQTFRAPSTQSAMVWLIARHPLRFVGAFLRSYETDRFAAAVFRMQAKQMAKDYARVFGQLAAEFDVTIVGGSIVLPDPQVESGLIKPGAGPLYNISVVFHPDGKPDPLLVRKIHPIPDEAGFTAAAPAADLPVFNTSAGTLGVLICADSWHPDSYAAFAGRGVQTLAVPAFLQPANVWQSPWHGYTTGWPDDADKGDEMRLTEHTAWLRYALAGRMKSTGAKTGATAFLRGNLWDMGSDGANILVTQTSAWVDGQRGGASISVLPLNGKAAVSP